MLCGDRRELVDRELQQEVPPRRGQQSDGDRDARTAHWVNPGAWLSSAWYAWSSRSGMGEAGARGG